MIRFLFRWSWRFIIFVLCLMVLAIGLTYALVGTESGFKLTSGQLTDRIPGLELENVDGTLLDGISTTALSYKNEQIAIQANGIDSKWTSELFGRRLDIKHAVIDELDIQLFETEKVEHVPSGDPIVLPAFSLPVSFNAENVHIKRLRIKSAGVEAPEQIIEDARLAIEAEGESITIRQLEAKYQNFRASVKGDIKLIDGYPLSLDITTIGDEIIEGVNLRANTKLTNSVENLQIQSRITNPVDATISGDVQPLDSKLPATLTLEMNEATWPIEGTAPPMVSLSNVKLEIDGNLDDYQYSLNANAEGDTVPATQLRARGFANPSRVLIPDIVVKTLNGSVSGKGGLALSPAITWVSNLTLKDLNPGEFDPELEGKLDGQIIASGAVDGGLWSVNLPEGTITGELRGFPFALDAALSKSLDNEIKIDHIDLENGNNRLNATGNVSETWNVEFDANLPQLQNFMPGLAGGFSAKGKIAGELKTPDLILDANAAVVKFNDVLLRGLKIDADINSAGEQPSSAIVTANAVNQGTNQFSNIEIKLDGTRLEHRLKAFVDGPSKTSVDIAANGNLSDTFDWNGAVNAATIELPGHKLTLQNKINLDWQHTATALTVSPHCWASQDATLCLENEVKSTESGNAKIAINNYALEQLDLFLPAASRFKGIFTANTELLWGDKHPGGFMAVLDAKIDDGVVRVTDQNGRRAEFKYKKFEFSTEASPENVDARLSVSSSTMGNADVLFNLNPSSEDQAISGDVSLDGLSISLLKAFLPEIQTIDGAIKADGTISGSLVDPKFDGNVYLENLKLASEILPLSVKGGDITTRIKGKRAFIFGQLQSGDGTVDVEGSANWQQIDNWRANIALTGSDLSIVQVPITQSRVDPDINIAVTPGEINITGSVDVPSARINIKELPKGATTLSPDIIVVEDEEENEQRKQELEQNNLVAKVNVNVILGDDVKLSGYGLDATLSGNMSVRIVSPKPVQLGGELRIVKGVYKSYGQDLSIENGQILFVGPIDQTALDMEAVREIESEERKAGLRVAGKLSDPEVTLFTDPADKSQEAILSYIVLGRDIAEASDQESSLLASAALALTLKGGRNVGGSIAEGLGIKEFELDARGKGDDTEVIVSGRVSDRLLLRYGRNVFEPESTLYLRYDITKKLYLEAARGIERAVDLFYSFSF